MPVSINAYFFIHKFVFKLLLGCAHAFHILMQSDYKDFAVHFLTWAFRCQIFSSRKSRHSLYIREILLNSSICAWHDCVHIVESSFMKLWRIYVQPCSRSLNGHQTYVTSGACHIYIYIKSVTCETAWVRGNGKDVVSYQRYKFQYVDMDANYWFACICSIENNRDCKCPPILPC